MLSTQLIDDDDDDEVCTKSIKTETVFTKTEMNNE